MKQAAAFFKLVRWPNLLFIALTQLLFYSCVYLPLFGLANHKKIAWLVAASVFIAAAGYIINDYFDLNIDQINKPGKNVFAAAVSRRWAILLHFALNICGLLFTYVAVGPSHWYLLLAHLGCILLLWLYSTSLKRTYILGNVVVSLLTAWTVLVVFLAFTQPGQALGAENPQLFRFFRITFLYAGFAFMISLVREVVKDMEDFEGDARYGCKTLPIVSGIRTGKLYAMVWMVMLGAALLVLVLYLLLKGWWWAALYVPMAVLIPLLRTARNLQRAENTAAFAAVSRLTKWVMLTGIFSMVFFRIYFS